MAPGTVTLRRATPEDAASYLRLMETILRETPPVDAPYAPEDFDPDEADMRLIIGGYALSGNSLFLVAEGATPGALAGAMTCRGGRLTTDAHVADLGIYVDRRYRGYGLGTQLLDMEMAWAAGHPIIRRVQLEVMATNSGAIRLYERFAFEREGLRRRAVVRGSEPADMLMMAWLAPEYR